MPYCGYPDEVAFTGNGPAATSCRPPPCFRNPKMWSKAIPVRSKNTAIGWIFNQLLGRTFSGPTEGIFRILPPRSGIQVHIQYVTMPESKSFTYRPGLPVSLQQGKLLFKNDLQASVFKQCVIVSTQNSGKAVLL